MIKILNNSLPPRHMLLTCLHKTAPFDGAPSYTQTQPRGFVIFEFIIWNLFVFWDLDFVI